MRRSPHNDGGPRGAGTPGGQWTASNRLLIENERLQAVSHHSDSVRWYQEHGASHRPAVTGLKLGLDQLTAAEFGRVELRAKHLYRGLPPALPWGDTDEATRNELRRRALSLMLFDGSLLHGTLRGNEDYGYTEQQELDSEVAAVIRGELRAGELWRPESHDEGGSHGN